MTEEDNLILDFEETAHTIDIATKEQRIVNYVIDQIATFILGGLLIVPIIENMEAPLSELAFALMCYSIGFGVALIYYSSLEHLTGKSIGKMITKTIVVTESGRKPSFFNTLGRTLCRFIPLEPLSFLFRDDGKGWHDTISKTLVVNE